VVKRCLPLLVLGSAMVGLALLQGIYLCSVLWLPGPERNQWREKLADINTILGIYKSLYILTGSVVFVILVERQRLILNDDGDLLLWSFNTLHREESSPPQFKSSSARADAVHGRPPMRHRATCGWWARAISRASTDLFQYPHLMSPNNYFHHILFIILLFLFLGLRDLFIRQQNTPTAAGEDWRVELGWLLRTVAVLIFADFRGVYMDEEHLLRANIDRWVPKIIQQWSIAGGDSDSTQQYASINPSWLGVISMLMCLLLTFITSLIQILLTIPGVISEVLFPAFLANRSQRMCTTLLVVSFGLEAWQRLLPAGHLKTPLPGNIHQRTVPADLHGSSVVFALLPHFLVLKYQLEQYWIWRQRQQDEEGGDEEEQDSMEEGQQQLQQQPVRTKTLFPFSSNNSSAAEHRSVKHIDEERNEMEGDDFIILEASCSTHVVHNRNQTKQQQQRGCQRSEYRIEEEKGGGGQQRQPLPSIPKRNLLHLRRRHLSEPRTLSRCFQQCQPRCVYCSMELTGMLLCKRCSDNNDFFCEGRSRSNTDAKGSSAKKARVVQWWWQQHLESRHNIPLKDSPLTMTTHHIGPGPFGCLAMEPLFDWLLPLHRQLWDAFLPAAQKDGRRKRRR
jgi:hypothetical protein